MFFRLPNIVTIGNMLCVVGIALTSGCASVERSPERVALDDEERVESLGSAIKRKSRDANKSGVKTVSVEEVASARSSGASTIKPQGAGQ